MKKYLIKANALIANRSHETGLFVLISIIVFASYSAFVPNKIIFSNSGSDNLTRKEIISCAPNSFYNEPFDPSLEEVQINDNRKPAGEVRNGIYYINLEIREGNWYPESKEGRPIKITAIAEAGKPLQVPGPLISVPEGTEIRATKFWESSCNKAKWSISFLDLDCKRWNEPKEESATGKTIFAMGGYWRNL
jgi:hypothetical protein